MRFFVRKRRQTPTVIIVALIDVLIVLLIFLIVTTTFKQTPALKLALPESSQPKQGASENAPTIITIAKQEPYFFLGPNPVTLDKLTASLKATAEKNPAAAVTIRADTDAPFGKIVNVMDAAKAAKIKAISAVTQPTGGK